MYNKKYNDEICQKLLDKLDKNQVKLLNYDIENILELITYRNRMGGKRKNPYGFNYLLEDCLEGDFSVDKTVSLIFPNLFELIEKFARCKAILFPCYLIVSIDPNFKDVKEILIEKDIIQSDFIFYDKKENRYAIFYDSNFGEFKYDSIHIEDNNGQRVLSNGNKKNQNLRVFCKEIGCIFENSKELIEESKKYITLEDFKNSNIVKETLNNLRGLISGKNLGLV